MRTGCKYTDFTQCFLHIMVTLLLCLIQPHLFRVPAECTVYVQDITDIRI